MKTILKSVYLNLRRVFLNGLGLFLRLGAAPSGSASPANILFIRIDRIGDLVLSTPALKAIKERYPEAKLTALVSPVTAPLLAAAPGVSRVLVWDPAQGWAGLAEAIKTLRRLRFDVAIDPYEGYELKTALIAFASGAPVRAGYRGYGREIFLNVSAAPVRERAHFVKEAFGVLKALGIDAPVRAPELFTSKEAQIEAGKLLSDFGVVETDLLAAVHPGGYYPAQRWMPERFAAVVSGLISAYGAKVVLIGSSRERDLVEKIAGGVTGTANERTIMKAVALRADVLCALMGRSRIFIGNNSGPLHMAGALNIPSVSTMGPTDPVRWSPLGRDQVFLRSGLKCSPCAKGSCKSHKCMSDLTVAMMMERVESLLSKQGVAKKELDHKS